MQGAQDIKASLPGTELDERCIGGQRAEAGMEERQTGGSHGAFAEVSGERDYRVA